MKYILTFYAWLILMGFSCFERLELDHNTQIRVNGIVTDEDGRPLKGIPVFLEGYIAHFEDAGLIQSVTSKADGTYSFIFPSTSAKVYILHINRNINANKQNLINTAFAEKTVLFTNKFIQNFELDFSQYGKLNKASKLIFKCSASNTSNVALNISSSNDIKIDTTLENESDFLFFPNLKTRDLTCSKIDTVYIKPLDSVFLTYFRNNNFIRDTIFIKESTFTYILRD